ncbi:MAG: cyclic nucleotide-binding domain-containing protein [Proteobacteria bacterium]|nr:cyclic nucleotide-binding domain-containing protein [Pseudomonadota bacterium]
MNIQRSKTDWKYGTRVIAAGDTVFREGDLGAEAYIVESGAVEIRKSVAGQADGKVLGNLTAGAVFGEMALVDDRPRMGTAMCTQDTVLRVIPVDVFESKIQQADPFIRAIVRVLVRNARANASTSAETFGE